MSRNTSNSFFLLYHSNIVSTCFVTTNWD